MDINLNTYETHLLDNWDKLKYEHPKEIYKIDDINNLVCLDDNKLNDDNIINKVLFICSSGKMGIIKKLSTKYIYIIPFIIDINEHRDNNTLFMTTGEYYNYYKYKNLTHINKKDEHKQEKILLSYARHNNIVFEFDVNIFYNMFVVAISNFKYSSLIKMVHCNKIYDEMFNNAFKRDVRNLRVCLEYSKEGTKEYYLKKYEEKKEQFIQHYKTINYKIYENLINDIENETVKKLVNDVKELNILES